MSDKGWYAITPHMYIYIYIYIVGGNEYSYLWKSINDINFGKIDCYLSLYPHISRIYSYTVNVCKNLVQAMFERKKKFSCTNIHFAPLYIYIYIYIYTLTHTHTNTHIYIYIYMHTYIHTYIYVCVCVCVCVISSQRPKSMGLDYSCIEYMPNIK